ncbi:MAG: universal stress protein, partial [Thermodesulfobacteriota bacterium]
VKRGEVEKSINELSMQRKADIVIIGNSGKNLLTRILIGSNTLKILRSSKLPVLNVPGVIDGNKYKINKILVPFNIAEDNTESLDYAINLALKTDSSITIVYVLSVANNIMDFPQEVLDQIIRGITKSLEETVLSSKENLKKLHHDKGNDKYLASIDNLIIRRKIIVGISQATKILDYAKRNKFDLIVMNRHGKGEIESFFLGSVTEEVVRNSKCPVISIKPE